MTIVSEDRRDGREIDEKVQVFDGDCSVEGFNRFHFRVEYLSVALFGVPHEKSVRENECHQKAAAYWKFDALNHSRGVRKGPSVSRFHSKI